MYRNYIFDLYGTLVDIHTNEKKPYLWKKMAWYLSMKGAEYVPAKLRQRYEQLVLEAALQVGEGGEIDIGKVFRRLYQEQGVAVSDMEIADTARAFRCISLEKLRLFDGVPELLTALRAAGKKIFLLSNAQALFTAPELRILGLEPYFDGILLSSDMGFKKPSPEFYDCLIKRYGLKPEESVMTGNDDAADCRGAARMGMDSYYICTEQSPKRTGTLPENCREIKDIREVFELK